MTCAQLNALLNADSDLTLCCFKIKEIVWVVERIEPLEDDLTCPFIATDKAHAISWIERPPVAAPYATKAVAYKARKCHCGNYLLIRQAKPEEVE